MRVLIAYLIYLVGWLGESHHTRWANETDGEN